MKKQSKDSLGDRMKKYEAVTNTKLLPRSPVFIRVDGKAHHTLTRGCEKPFDAKYIRAMEEAAFDVASEIQGFKMAYVQSDEVTFLLTDFDTFETSGWFDYKLQKIVSVSAALMTFYFNKYYDSKGKLAVFDSRAFTVPLEEIPNVFLWRALDWKRNSIQMYAHANFSNKQLHKKNQNDMHEMLHSIGKNWTNDLTEQQKNGTFIYRDNGKLNCRYNIKPDYYSIKTLWEETNGNTETSTDEKR